jgi:hypothetical protein
VEGGREANILIEEQAPEGIAVWAGAIDAK